VRYLLAPLCDLRPPPVADGASPLATWAAAVRGASEACVLLDDQATVAAASPAFAELVGVPVAALTGARLFDSVLRVLDWGAEAPVRAEEAARVPPLLALSAGALARSLLRVRRRDGTCLTLDAVSSPLHGRPEDGIVGSVTFLHLV